MYTYINRTYRQWTNIKTKWKNIYDTSQYSSAYWLVTKWLKNALQILLLSFKSLVLLFEIRVLFRNVLKYRWGWLLRIMVSKYRAPCIMQELRDFYVVCQNLWIWISSNENSLRWLFFKHFVAPTDNYQIQFKITSKWNLRQSVTHKP